MNKKQVNAIGPKDVHKVLSRVLLVDGFDFVYDIDNSHGRYLVDALTGKEYLDFFSMFASWPISHNHPKLKNFKTELAKYAAHNPANSDIYTVEMAKFVATFERVCMPEGFKHLFLVQGGSNAVENALKAAFDWKVRKNMAAGNGERGKKILHFKEAFHGRGGYTMSLTNTQDPNKYKYFALFDWPRVENPKAIFPLTGKNLELTQQAEERSIAQIRSILDKEAVDIAAIIIEPIQGEGGDNHFRPEFWNALRKISDEYDVLLIADEVQAGMGITGKMWSHEHYGNARPDIIVFGKKAQVCGIIAGPRIDTVKDNVFQVSSRINSTWGGNLVDMARSRRFLEIIEEDKLMDNAAKVGAYLLKQIEGLQKTFPNFVTGARGKGLLCSFEVPTGDDCAKVKRLAYERGILLISCGNSTIRFRPLLDTTTKEIDIVISALRDIMKSLAGRSAL